MSTAPKLDLRSVTPHITFASEEGKVWLNEQRIMLFSLAALGKFRKEVYETLGKERCKAFFLRLGFQLGILDGELARTGEPHKTLMQRFMVGPQLHALRGMVLPTVRALRMNEDGSDFYCEVEWRNSYEVDIYKTMMHGMKEPACWNLAGYASGYASTFLQRTILFDEVECAICGLEHCLAIGKPAEEWENREELEAYYKPDGLLEELNELQGHVESLQDSLQERELLADIVGSSKPFRNALNMVTKASDSKVSVLLLGETGVGKEVMARALHRYSDRADKSFVAVNCAAIPPDLIESELFGVEKGAYTGATSTRMGRFERANNGTIFLDEVIELTPRAQASLLRVLQEQELERVGDNTVRKVNVRVVAATNEDLGEAVKAGRFRADLYYRLSAYPVRIPSLRERKEDIPLFVDFFLEKYKSLHNKAVRGISDRGMAMLNAYAWPGNIRELENVIERAVILAEPHSQISMDLILGPSVELESTHAVNGDGSLVDSEEQSLVTNKTDIAEFMLDQEIGLEDLEEAVLKRAMERADGNVSKAARLLGMTRPAFAYRWKKIEE